MAKQTTEADLRLLELKCRFDRNVFTIIRPFRYFEHANSHTACIGALHVVRLMVEGVASESLSSGLF